MLYKYLKISIISMVITIIVYTLSGMIELLGGSNWIFASLDYDVATPGPFILMIGLLVLYTMLNFMVVFHSEMGEDIKVVELIVFSTEVLFLTYVFIPK